MIQLEKENSSFNIYEQHFLIDSESELQTLESEYTCRQGDKAELPDGSYYLRHSDDYQGDLWELVKSSSGGSGSSDLPPITSDDDGSFLVAQNGEWGKVGGYSKNESTDLIITEQTVTTTETGGEFCGASLTGTLVGLNTNDTVKVTYNNAEYILTVYEINDAVAFGTDLFNEPFSDNIPFIIEGNNEMTYLITPTTQTATVKVEKANENIEVSDTFIRAVDAAINAPTVIFPTQEIDITAETDQYDGELISFASGVNAATIASAGAENVVIKVNGNTLVYDSGNNLPNWAYETEEFGYYVWIEQDGTAHFITSDLSQSNPTLVSGTYTVKGYVPKMTEDTSPFVVEFLWNSSTMTYESSMSFVEVSHAISTRPIMAELRSSQDIQWARNVSANNGSFAFEFVSFTPNTNNFTITLNVLVLLSDDSVEFYSSGYSLAYASGGEV